MVPRYRPRLAPPVTSEVGGGAFGPRWIPLTGLIVLLLFGTKWASYIGLGPLFVSDVLFILGAAHVVATLALRPSKAAGRRGATHVAVIIFFMYALARLAFAEPSVNSLRDFAPHMYLLIMTLPGALLISSRGRERSLRLLRLALIGHLSWILLASLGLLAPVTVSWLTNSQAIFSIRTDIDSALCGVLAALALSDLLSGKKIALPVAVLLASWSAVLMLSTRAGLISAILCSVVVVVIYMPRSSRSRLQMIVFVSPLLLGALIAVLPTTDAGMRLLDTFGGQYSGYGGAASAEGTTAARSEAWAQIVKYVLDDPARLIFGVGYGFDYMNASGADFLLLGHQDETVRSPHNVLIGTLARLGIVGLMVFLLVIFTPLLAWRRCLKKGEAPDELLTVCGLIVVAVLVTSMFGVVLESPFGAVPFAWAGGVLVSSVRGARDVEGMT